MSDGDMYVYSDRIPVEMNSAAAKAGYEEGWDAVQGCIPHIREPHAIAVQWIAPTQMAQLAPGTRWCSCCGDVRPVTYFDVLAYDDDSKPVRYADECRQCINGRDPKLAKEKFCSACKVMHLRDVFADDERYVDGKYPSCRNAKQRYDTASHARSKWLNEGKLPDQWGGHRERTAV